MNETAYTRNMFQTEHWFLRAPKPLADLWASIIEVGNALNTIQSWRGILIRCYAESDQPELPSFKKSGKPTPSRDAVMGVFIQNIGHLRDKRNRAAKAFMPFEEVIGSVAEPNIQYESWRDDGELHWRTTAASWHEMFLAISLDVLVEFLLRVSPEAAGKKQQAFSYWGEVAFAEEDVFEQFRQHQDSLRDLFAMVHSPSIEDVFSMLTRMQQELFRAWKQEYPAKGSTYETIDGNSVEARRFIRQMERSSLPKMDRNIIAVLERAGHRLVTTEILTALELHFGPTAESTTKLHLANLVDKGLLDNKQAGTPKGYGLPEWD